MMTSESRTFKSWVHHIKWQHLVAGVSGGVVSTMVLQPLDLVKVRLQVDEGVGNIGVKRPHYRGLTHALVSIYRQSGVRGWYQGVTPNLVGAGSSWGLYFFFYNAAKSFMQSGDSAKQLDAGRHVAGATFAGVVTLFMTNPVWVTKTRLYLQYGRGAHASTQYSGMLDALVTIARNEGVRGLYKGLVPGLFGVSHGALQFMAYEEMKNRYNLYNNRPINVKLTAFEYLTFAAISKMFAAATTYPYQVVRSRLQDQHRVYMGNVDVIRQIWTYEGVRGFYKGLWPNLLRVTPACCITFVVYEKMTSWFMPHS